MKKRAGAWLIVFIMLFGAAALPTRGLIYIGVQAGWSAQKPSLTNVEFDTNTRFLYGLRAGVRLLSVAVELNYFQAAHNMKPKDFLLLSWKDKEADYSFIGINAKVYLPIPILSPYLTAGYGYYSADIQDIGQDKSGGFNVGLGAELMLGKKFSLLAEGRYHYAKLDIEQKKLTLGDFTFSGGFNVHF